MFTYLLIGRFISSSKPKGATHCAYPTQNIGRFFATYMRADGSIVCQSRTYLIGPKVLLKAEVKEGRVLARYKLEPGVQSSWDWVGLFLGANPCFQQYETWSYVDTVKDTVALEMPVTPGEYVCCYFCSGRRYCPVAFSNFLVVPDVNSITTNATTYTAGASCVVTFDIKCHSRDPR
jgi:hypothetical protein